MPPPAQGVLKPEKYLEEAEKILRKSSGMISNVAVPETYWYLMARYCSELIQQGPPVPAEFEEL